jgi:NodT family efflux transporter outer membrane factor (OMF) lipoprotein
MGDSALEGLIEEAWANNPDLSAASRRVDMAREQAAMAGADRLPQAGLGLSGSQTKRNMIGFNFPGASKSFTTESYGLNLNVSWELDLWGRLRDGRRAAKVEWQASSEDYRAARLSLAGQVAKSWYSAIEANRQLALAAETEETYSRNASYVATRFERGLSSALDHNLAQSSLASSRAIVTRWKRQGDLATRTLENLLGRHPDGNASLAPTLPAPPSSPMVSPPTQTLEKRPDMRAARLRLKAAGLQKSIARKHLLPAFSLTGSPGSRSEEFGELLDQQFRIWSVTGNLIQPIFQGGRIRANVRHSEAVLLASVDSYKANALNAFREAETALAAESLLQEEEANLDKAAKAAKTAADLSWDRYQRGLEGIFTTLESSRRAFEAESRLLSLRRDRLLNRIDLHLALGDEALPEKP